MSPEENFNPDDRSVESHQYKSHTILILNPEKSHREQSYIILGPNGDVVDQWWDNLTVGISYLDAAKEHINFYEPPSTDKVTVDRDVVQRLINSMLHHTEPLGSTNNAVDYIIARRQIGNPLVRAGEELPGFMYDGRFEPDHQYDTHTEEVRNLMYRLTQVLEKGEKAQSDIWEEDLPPIEDLQTQEYDVTYVRRVDEMATVTVEASSEEEAIQKAKEGDFKGEMDTSFLDWVTDMFSKARVELKGETDNS
jgi:hypothetical protein